MSKGFLKKYMSAADLDGIASKIAELERTTSGEIRVSIRHRRHWRERNMPVHEIALREFHRMGMHRTAGRTGVLILLLFSERKFHIVADEGIHAKVEEGTWERVAEGISLHFRKGNFRGGLIEAVELVGALLASHFPPAEGNRNELSDEVDVR
jgi:uncharacterized membrane protein